VWKLLIERCGLREGRKRWPLSLTDRADFSFSVRKRQMDDGVVVGRRAQRIGSRAAGGVNTADPEN
jgi:hypothetical protein